MSEENGPPKPRRRKADDAQDHRARSGSPLVVGVGGSSAAAESMERFVARLEPGNGYAVVLVVQHREALDEARLRRAVEARPGARLTGIGDGSPVEPGIFLADPDLIVTIEDRRFRTRKARQRPGERGTIDSFLLSLADDLGEAAVAVILRGTAGDGTLGIAAVKEAGGLTIAERRPAEDAHEADIGIGKSPDALADFVLAPEEIPARIEAHARHLERSQAHGRDVGESEVTDSLGAIAAVLRNQTGHDFHGYKRNTFARRVQRRMQVVQASSAAAYLEHLRNEPGEAQELFNDLLIGVTQFFRDPKEFEALETLVIPRLFQGKGAGSHVRVWVLGCATGEEVYSLAILLRERMAALEEVPHVQIFATDIDGRALAAARVGRYPESIAADVSPERLARWFVKEGNTYCVSKDLREMCIFSAHNVIRDAPFSRLDLISCRNLLIYLNADLQNRVIPLFHFALAPHGFLFLGNAENVTRHPRLFQPVDRRSRIYERIETAARVLPDFPVTTAPSRNPAEAAPARQRTPAGSLARRAERIAERYAPAYVIVDERFDVLHFSGRIGRFIEPTSGSANLELLNLVHRDLRLDLMSALQKAAEEDRPTRASGIEMGTNGSSQVIDIVVEPSRERPDGVRHFVVIFKDGPGHDQGAGAEDADRPEAVHVEHVRRLENELRVTRERLQATIEELESTNEELKSSNEEYQSLNEELQSANEELETSKEELQSVNEELTTVNGELAHRVQELMRATSDLKNFLESTQIATLFLDNDLRIMNFTPAITEIFHLVETDLGRPIGHIKSRFAVDELQEDARKVLRSLGSAERRIEAPTTHAHYIVRVLPYRSVDNFIAGVVITFVDVTPLTRAEEQQKLLLSELQHRVRNTLGVVRAIARRTAETSSTVQEYAMHLDGRLGAFARVQSAVTRDPAAGLDLESMVADELLAYAAQEGDRVSIEGPTVRLMPKAAETLGLAIHELATNAMKYGALSTDTGRIRVSWQIGRDGNPPHLVFSWIESGTPASEKRPRRRGFGTELLEQTLNYELRAQTRLAYGQDGLHCTIDLPLTDRVAVTP